MRVKRRTTTVGPPDAPFDEDEELALCFSPQGTRLAIARESHVLVLDLDTTELECREVNHHLVDVSEVIAGFRDEDTLLVAHGRKYGLLTAFVPGAVAHAAEMEGDEVNAVVSGDGRTTAWLERDTSNGRQTIVFRRGDDPPVRMPSPCEYHSAYRPRISQDGSRLALVTSAGTAVLDTATGARLWTGGDWYRCTFNPAGTWLAVEEIGAPLTIVDVRSGSRHQVLDETALRDLRDFAYDADNATFIDNDRLVLCLPSGLALWNVEDGAASWLIKTDDVLDAITVAPNGSALAFWTHRDVQLFDLG